MIHFHLQKIWSIKPAVLGPRFCIFNTVSSKLVLYHVNIFWVFITLNKIILEFFLKILLKITIHVKNCEGLETLLCLQNDKLAHRSLMDVVRRHLNPGSRPRDFMPWHSRQHKLYMHINSPCSQVSQWVTGKQLRWMLHKKDLHHSWGKPSLLKRATIRPVQLAF